MTRYNPSDVDHLLEHPAARHTPTDLPADYFSTMEQRILAATVLADKTAEEHTEEAGKPAETALATMAAPRTHSIRHAHPLWFAAAAAVLLLVCGITLKYLPHHDNASNAAYDIDNLYAVTDDTDDGEIDDLEEIYEADVFLEDL